MLSLLHIENIAVIESADISNDGGITVLPGETGAGNSIVNAAISAILGERAYRDMIRTGANKATVRAVFTGVPKLQWFEDNGVEYDPETIVQREIFLDGKNVCRVNGSLVTVSLLRKLGIQLINIHGPHDSAYQLDEDTHLAFLDAFAGNEALRSDYGEKYETVAKLRREIDRLTMDEGEKLRRMETLKYQIAEIEKAELEPGEDERLEDRRKILQNAEKLSNGMETAVECLYGGDDTDGAAGLLAQAEYALARLSRFSDSFNALHERVADLMYQVQDAAEEVRAARDGLSYSADELEQIESRRDVIHKPRRKYGTTCEDILAYLDSARKELDDIEFADDHLERLKGKLQKAEKAAWDAAIALRENRKAAAEAMSERILTEQLEKGRQELSYLESVVQELQQAELEQDFNDIRTELTEGGYLRGRDKQPPGIQRASRPREFRSTAGLRILVGRSNRQNDRLTCKDADRRDIWFHTQKIHGSHVILCTNGGEPGDQDITEAAGLAAYYSQAKDRAKVPVACTQVKYNKHPAGARPGMVIYTTYRTVNVTPAEDLVKRLQNGK